MKIGVYVGSFNPVHKGHIEIINYLLNNHYVDKIMVIPTLNYWDKTNLINIEDRIKMLKFYETDKIIINDTLNNFPYTYQVLDNLKENDLYLIIGADNLEKFHLWKNIDMILENKVIVIPRNNVDISCYITKFKQKNNFIVTPNFLRNIISATMVRQVIRHKEKLNEYLDENIINYIKENNLYGG